MTSLIAGSLLLVLHVGQLPGDSFTDEELARFRRVFHRTDGIAVGTVYFQDNGIAIRGLIPPTQVANLYRKNPRATLSLLGAIVETGSPWDARKAMAFYYGLAGPPEAWVTMMNYDEDIDRGTPSVRSIWREELRSHLRTRESPIPLSTSQ